ncbi:PEP-CTERM sorting domain-containing protein [Novosphingobium sp. YAF33]|uniref:PEP-CTERM sorting domain-containing protein n=1 Tax=Novosphingobium sp. YAF33 TaxID=3233082 RepID=UPI003F97DC4E
MPRYRCLPAFAAMVLVPLPAFAADATRLPEPSGLFLLALGVTGVAIGRRFSSKPRTDRRPAHVGPALTLPPARRMGMA